MRKFRVLVSLAFVLGLITIVVLSCNKGNKMTIKPTITGIKATIINAGPVAADGCDYLVQIDPATFYHADNLPTAFQKDKLNVVLSYNLFDAAFQCGMNPNTHIPVIHITAIKAR